MSDTDTQATDDTTTETVSDVDQQIKTLEQEAQDIQAQHRAKITEINNVKAAKLIDQVCENALLAARFFDKVEEVVEEDQALKDLAQFIDGSTDFGCRKGTVRDLVKHIVLATSGKVLPNSALASTRQHGNRERTFVGHVLVDTNTGGNEETRTFLCYSEDSYDGQVYGYAARESGYSSSYCNPMPSNYRRATVAETEAFILRLRAQKGEDLINVFEINIVAESFNDPTVIAS